MGNGVDDDDDDDDDDDNDSVGDCSSLGEGEGHRLSGGPIFPIKPYNFIFSL